MPLDALPEELQAECTIYLGVTSAHGGALRPGQQGVQGARRREDAGHSRCARPRRAREGLFSLVRGTGGDVAQRRRVQPNQVFRGGAKIFKCSCSPDKECRIGMGATNLARHLGSRQHWEHWRLVAFGEAQPTMEAWRAFAAAWRESPRRA